MYNKCKEIIAELIKVPMASILDLQEEESRL